MEAVKASGNISAPNVISGAFFGNGSGLINVNASLFGGQGPGAFAQLGTSNVFGVSQTIDGNLNLARDSRSVRFRLLAKRTSWPHFVEKAPHRAE